MNRLTSLTKHICCNAADTGGRRKTLNAMSILVLRQDHLFATNDALDIAVSSIDSEEGYDTLTAKRAIAHGSRLPPMETALERGMTVLEKCH